LAGVETQPRLEFADKGRTPRLRAVARGDEIAEVAHSGAIGNQHQVDTGHRRRGGQCGKLVRADRPSVINVAGRLPLRNGIEQDGPRSRRVAVIKCDRAAIYLVEPHVASAASRRIG